MSPRATPDRPSGVFEKIATSVGGIVLAFVIVGCDVAIAPPTTGSAAPTGFPMLPSQSPGPADLPLDASSRLLLAVLDPADEAQVVVGTTWTDELSRAARQAGMRVEIVDANGSVQIVGPVGAVLDLLDGVPVTSVTVQESTDAMRSIPANRPVVEVPNPGRPYLVGGFAGDLSKVAIPSPQREAMLRTLGETIQTIDGRPYAQLQLDGSCGADKSGPSCGLSAVGLASGSTGEDDWSIRATARTGLGGAVEGNWTTSVPRSLVRAAEWLARHDAAALPRIRRFTTCCGATWDPARAGQVTLVYSRICAAARMPDRDVAETGVCEDDLTITVDLRAGTVVAITEPARG